MKVRDNIHETLFLKFKNQTNKQRKTPVTLTKRVLEAQDGGDPVPYVTALQAKDGLKKSKPRVSPNGITFLGSSEEMGALSHCAHFTDWETEVWVHRVFPRFGVHSCM